MALYGILYMGKLLQADAYQLILMLVRMARAYQHQGHWPPYYKRTTLT